jgi:hypothetical protein
MTGKKVTNPAFGFQQQASNADFQSAWIQFWGCCPEQTGRLRYLLRINQKSP